MLGWPAFGMVVARTLGLLDSYMIRSLRWMFFLGDYMATPSGWTVRILWCGWGQNITAEIHTP